MQLVTAENAAAYLIATGRLTPGERVEVRELAGGVSNVVLQVDRPGQPPVVLKQSRERLRVAAEWLSPLERIWTEVAATRLLGRILPEGTVPRVLFEDRDQFLYAMSCAPTGSAVWKSELLAGRTDDSVARRAGEILGAIHRQGASAPELSRPPLESPALFDSLRTDPYYRATARVHPDLAPSLDALIESMSRGEDRSLVLGDYSPKNILVHARELVVLDFETAHAGDPAFDLGFFASHLLLKSFRAARRGGRPEAYLSLLAEFERSYSQAAGAGDRETARRQRGVRHAAACLLARLDGKSQVDYRAELDQDRVRRLAAAVLRDDAPRDLASLGERAAREMRGG